MSDYAQKSTYVLTLRFFLTKFVQNVLILYRFKYNGSQLKNPDISGALFTLRNQYSYTQTQCEDAARDVRVLQSTPVSVSRI